MFRYVELGLLRSGARLHGYAVKVAASYDQAKQVAAEFARQRGLYLERGSRSIPSVEGMKTIAFEIVEQVSEKLPPVNGTSNHRNGWQAGHSPAWRAIGIFRQ